MHHKLQIRKGYFGNLSRLFTLSGAKLARFTLISSEGRGPEVHAELEGKARKVQFWELRLPQLFKNKLIWQLVVVVSEKPEVKAAFKESAGSPKRFRRIDKMLQANCFKKLMKNGKMKKYRYYPYVSVFSRIWIENWWTLFKIHVFESCQTAKALNFL